MESMILLSLPTSSNTTFSVSSISMYCGGVPHLWQISIGRSRKRGFELHAGAVHRYFYRGQPGVEPRPDAEAKLFEHPKVQLMMNPFFSNSEMNPSG